MSALRKLTVADIVDHRAYERERSELRERIVALGKEISADYSGRTPLLVGVLKGAFMFMSDLARAIDLPRYKKAQRGPKKPVEVKRTQRGAHRSTARVLNEQRHKT